MTQKEAVSFFETYADAFAAFDADRIADQFNIPVTILSGAGTAAFIKRDQLVRNFEAVNREHRALEFHRAKLSNCRILRRYGAKMVRIGANWRFERQDGSQIYEFPFEYVLGNYGQGWKISAAINIEG